MLKQPIYINALSVIAPGLIEPQTVHDVFSGAQKWQADALPKFMPSLLAKNERRRTTNVTNIALKAILPLLKAEQPSDEIATIFASSDGDLATDDAICKALARESKMVSPTQFGNSVHNAAAGYCAIGASLTGYSISLSSGNGTFSAGLLDSVSQLLSGQHTALMVAYDVTAPQPLHSFRVFEHSLALAMRLGNSPEESCLGYFNIGLDVNDNATAQCQNTSLEALRLANPIGAGIPMFEAIFKQQNRRISLPYIFDQKLDIEFHIL